MSEALQCMTEATRSKHPRTPAQLEALRQARQKAQQVRAQNADLRRKQAEIDKVATENAKRQKVERIEREYAALKGGCQESTEVDHESIEEEVDVVRKRSHPKRSRVVVMEDEESSDDIDAPTRPPVTPTYGRLYDKMFNV